MALDIPMRFDEQPLPWTVENVYSETECAAFIERIERASPTLATNNPLYRDQDRVIVDDDEVAADFFRRLRPHLPPLIGALSLEGLNARLRMYRYRPGQRFEPHMDHWYRSSRYRARGGDEATARAGGVEQR